MTAKFLGKWRIYVPPQAEPIKSTSEGYAAYEHSPGDSWSEWLNEPHGLCIWYVNWPDRGPCPPGKETNIAFLLRSDGKLCFLMNSGQYIGNTSDFGPFPFVNALDDATGFVFPGHDIHQLPPAFTGTLQNMRSGRLLNIVWDRFVTSQDVPAVSFTMSQVTAPLSDIQAGLRGDGLDFSWVDLTDTVLNRVSFPKADFSHCNLTNAKFTYVSFSGVDPTIEFPKIDLTHGANLPGANLTNTVLNKVSFMGADCSRCNLTDAKFTGGDFFGAVLTGAKLINAKFIEVDFSGAVLTGADLTGATFTNCTLLDGAVLTGADLTGATFTNCTLDRAFLTNCTLTNTKFAGSTLLGTHLEGATFQGTDLSNTRLAGAVFKQSDLTGVIANPPPQFYNTPLAPPSATNPRTSLAGCRLDQSLVGNDWSMLDLTDATILNLSSPLSSQTKPLKASYAILKGLNQNNLVGLSLKNAVFDYAVLDGLGLNTSESKKSDLTDASFIQASMHETNLTGAILTRAKMSGAQLGSLRQLFTLETSFKADLNAGQSVDAALRGQFSQHGITLSESATLTNPAPNRVWQLNDVGNNLTYTIRLETESDTTLTVCAPAVSASLVDAYMPDAVLTGANLSGVQATGAQFYGSNARLDGSAILEGVEFNDANLSNVNLTQANLFGANLSRAHLFNAKFNKANLGPSTNKSANLSDANLQGADFTDAQLYGANLSNAAVAVKVPTKAVPDQGGVYLFSLPYAGDTNTLQQYTEELNAAASTLTKTRAAFQQNGMTLRSQASAAVDTAGKQWLLDNDSQSQEIFTGYVKFIVKLNGSVLEVYGTAVRIERLGDEGLQMDTEPCNLTKIFPNNMNPKTICPNGTTLGVNQQGGKNWDELWLRAATPPKPPTCVPTDDNWCPQTQTTNQPLNRGKQRRNENE